MTAPSLPPAFICRMQAQLGPDAGAFFSALQQPPCRGLRRNPLKQIDCSLSSQIGLIGNPVPWEPRGYLIPTDSRAGAHPLHEAGAYYLQEPSAMLPATLLAVQPGETVLDLCAAPGGKSTQLAAALAGRGTLVCNEIVPNRAQILSRNLERMGVTNSLVISADPSRLAAAWPQLFDAVLVDAPCSGEGMFRRHPETRLEWSEDTPARCATRQLLILESACAMLKVGGRLCYSTCTFSPEENENVVTALLLAHPELQPLPFSVAVTKDRVRNASDGMIRLSPHEVEGEGQFAALFVKTGFDTGEVPSACHLLPAMNALECPDRSLTDLFRDYWRTLSSDDAPVPNACMGATLLAVPELPPLRGIRVLRAGLALGQAKGRVFAPDHALAMSAPVPSLPRVALPLNEAFRYLAGETMPAPESVRGYALATYAGLPLGFVKASDGMLKNHYPKGLRRMLANAPTSEGENDGND